MEITDIVVRRLENTGKLKAVVSITFDDCFVVHDVKVIESVNGLFIAMPSRKTPNGTYVDIVHPINSDFRNILSTSILDVYDDLIDQDLSTNREYSEKVMADEAEADSDYNN